MADGGSGANTSATAHPGKIFFEEFLKPLELAQAEAERRLGTSQNRMSEIILGKRSVTAETAVLFSALTGTSLQLWMSLHTNFDLWHALREVDTSKIEMARAG